ncbi:MAG: DUF6113 family protein [Sporichthyaceae bacterium]
MPAAVRVLLLVPAALAGAAAGLLGSFGHALEPVALPLGLLVGWGLSVAVFVTCGLVAGRPGAAAAVGGWLVVVLLLSTQRPEGDLVVAGSAVGYLWLLGGFVLAVGCLVPRYVRGGRPPARLPSADAEGGR